MGPVPTAHALTEVHLHCHREEQLRWFKYIYESCNELSSEGVAIAAVTSWAILGSFGWNKLLTVPRGEYEPGAYDMRSGVPRATALVAYIKNITGHNGVNKHLTSDKGWWQRDTRLIYRPAAVELNAVKFNYDVRPVAIIGRTGTLGKAFAKVCSDRAISCVVLGREDCDISEPYTIERIIQQYKPWAIINAAGYVKVDEAEADAETCFRTILLVPITWRRLVRGMIFNWLHFLLTWYLTGKRGNLISNPMCLTL
jgi:dTDP-4-dehydrorhamnose reductase